jgi:hypothetical protein
VTDKASARIVGVLFIVASAAAVLSQVMLGSLLDDAGYLTSLADDQTQVRIGAVLDLATAAAVVAIPIMLYGVLKRHNETVSVAYLIARTLEAVVIVVGALVVLALLAVSQDFVASAMPDAESSETTGSMLLATRDLTDATGTQLIFSLTAVILNYSLYRSRLVPRFISIWGLIGTPLMLTAGVLALFGRDPFSTASVLLAAPLAINEMALAFWLIVRGFTTEETHADVAAAVSLNR